MLPDMNIELRAFNIEDATVIERLVGDESVSKWTSNIPFPYSEQNGIDWINQTDANPSKNPFAVEFNGQLVACVSYWPHDSGGVEVGYWVGRDFWGQGICTEALRKLLNSQQFLPVTDIFAKVMTENIGSQRVLEKCGFVFLENGVVVKDGSETKAKFYVRSAAT